jgi:hypothetical protein
MPRSRRAAMVILPAPSVAEAGARSNLSKP